MSGENHSTKKYWIVFAALAILTILEVLIAEIPNMRNFVIFGLIALAVAKAACVLFWYMHLSDETKGLKLSVVLPFGFPVLYAAVLIAEALYRGNIAIINWPSG